MSWSPQQDAAIKADGPYYVYEHVRLDTGLPFYVGKGKNGRMHSHHNRNRHWHNIVRKHGFEARLLVGGIDEELSLLAEIERIDQHVRLGTNLCNMTKGGEGASLTGEARERFLASQRDPEVQKRRSASLSASWADPETKARRRKSLVEAFENPEAKQRLREASSRNNARPEVRAKLSAAGRAYWEKPGVKEARLTPLLEASKAACARRVVCVETGASFPSVADAERWLRANGKPKASHTAIVNVCRGKLKSAYGYTWRYDDHVTRAAERITVVM